MADLRQPRAVVASTADYRPVTTGTGDGRGGGQGRERGQSDSRPVLRSRRNGLPVTPPYAYGESTYPWAARVIAAAEAEYGTPPATRGPRPRKELTREDRDAIRAAGALDSRRSRAAQGLGGPAAGRCPVCEYPLDSVGHRTECGGAS